MRCIPLDNCGKGTKTKNCFRYPLTIYSGYCYMLAKAQYNRKNGMACSYPESSNNYFQRTRQLSSCQERFSKGRKKSKLRK